MEKDEEPYEKQEAIAVIWDTESGERMWHIGFYFGKNVDGSLRVDHLIRDKRKHDLWKCEFSDTDDIQDVKTEQVIPVEVVGDCFFGNRKPLFVVDNWEEIENQFSMFPH